MYYNAEMLLRQAGCAALILVWGLIGGCARDTNDESTAERYPVEVKLAFRTVGSLKADAWYFMVFNFTAAPGLDVGTSPVDLVSTENRGRNWELYVAVSPRNTGSDLIATLKRSPLPTVLPTAIGPRDVAAGLITNDALVDLVVACREANAVQYLPGITTDIFEKKFFDSAQTLENGPQPVRVFVEQIVGESPEDILIIFAGADGQTPSIRLLERDGQGGSVNSQDLPLDPGIHVDSLMADVNDDGNLDLVLLTTQQDGGVGQVNVLLGDGAGSFASSDTMQTGTDPVQLSVGRLDEDGLDLSVACRGPALGSGIVNLYDGAGDGTFSPYAVPELTLPGSVTSGLIAQMLRVGTDPIDDVLVGFIDDSGQGMLRVYINNVIEEDETPAPEDAFGTLFVETESQIRPDYIAAADTTGDDRLDALVLNGNPGFGGNTLMIQRGLTESEGLSTDFDFVWDPEPITYISGLEPSRIYLDDLDNNGFIDIVTPNSADDTAGNSISLFYGLGKDNFSSADLYWTDEVPTPLNLEEWYLSHTVGPNFFELTLDPALFYDLARRQPDSFIVDFMTATSGIDLVSNELQEGIVLEHLSQAISVPMTIGYYNDEQNNPRVNTEVVADPSLDIVDWRIEVL